MNSEKQLFLWRHFFENGDAEKRRLSSPGLGGGNRGVKEVAASEQEQKRAKGSRDLKKYFTQMGGQKKQNKIFDTVYLLLCHQSNILLIYTENTTLVLSF